MDEIVTSIDRRIDETGFWGVVQVVQDRRVLYARTSGLADRAHGVPNVLDTQFAIASGTKALTALAVMSLVTEGAFSLEESVRTLLGPGWEEIGRGVTVRHLLNHTSGIGDYLDEAEIEDVEEYVLDVPVHRLAGPSDLLPLIRGRPAKFPPGARFSYCNSGYVLLAHLIETISGRSYYDIVEEKVCSPAGMHATAFLRLDDLPGSAAIGYLPKKGWRTNYLHLPVRGAGDGGAYATVGDIARLWEAFVTARIVPAEVVSEMVRPQSEVAPDERGYGLGFWLSSGGDVVQLEGSDPGISFRSAFRLATGILYVVASNTTDGAWPVAREIEAALAGATDRPGS